MSNKIKNQGLTPIILISSPSPYFLEQCALSNIDHDIVNQMFDFMVRDFAGFALQIYGMHNTRDEQRELCKEIMLIKAQGDTVQYDRVWETYVASLNGEYEINIDAANFQSK